MIFGYVRCSTEGQVLGTSPEEQERKCRAIAQLRNAGAYDFQLFRDDAVSGKTPLPERPAGRELLAAAQKGDVVVASKLDRMFRNTLDALQMLEVFRQRGIHVILADLSAEPVTGEGIGKLVFGLMAMFADFERERINTRTTEGRQAKRQKDGHIGGDPPYGFKVSGAGRDAMLVPDETEQKVVDLMTHWWRRGFRAGTIRRIVAQHGYAPRSGVFFHPTQIKRICEYQEKLQHAAGSA